MKLDSIRLIRLVIAIVVIVLLIGFGQSSVFTVKESEQAVITTFGKYTKTVSAGLQFKLPWPIQSVTILPVNMTQKIELGYASDASGQYSSIPEESTMITGDMNIVNIDFFVEWKIDRCQRRLDPLSLWSGYSLVGLIAPIFYRRHALRGYLFGAFGKRRGCDPSLHFHMDWVEQRDGDDALSRCDALTCAAEQPDPAIEFFSLASAPA